MDPVPTPRPHSQLGPGRIPFGGYSEPPLQPYAGVDPVTGQLHPSLSPANPLDWILTPREPFPSQIAAQAEAWGVAPAAEADGQQQQQIAVLQEEVKSIKQELSGNSPGSPIWPPKPAGKNSNVFYVPRADCADPDNNVIFASWDVVVRHKWHGAVEGFTDIYKAGEYLLTHRRAGEYRVIFT